MYCVCPANEVPKAQSPFNQFFFAGYEISAHRRLPSGIVPLTLNSRAGSQSGGWPRRSNSLVTAFRNTVSFAIDGASGASAANAVERDTRAKARARARARARKAAKTGGFFMVPSIS